jgi:hypothetical protein
MQAFTGEQIPAFTSSSLYFPIAASSSWVGITPASDSFVALTITITFIAEILRKRARCSGRVLDVVCSTLTVMKSNGTPLGSTGEEKRV